MGGEDSIPSLYDGEGEEAAHWRCQLFVAGHGCQLIEQAVVDSDRSLDQSSDNFRWAAAVAEFGLLLRNSDFKGEATYAATKKLAKSAKGKDENGYRNEFINMIDTMQSLAEPEMADKNE